MRRLLALALFAALTSCASFQFERQRIFLRYQPETDVLDALIVYEGVGPSQVSWWEGKQEHEDKDAAATVAQIAQGKCHFLFGNWLLDFDLPEIVRELDREDPLSLRFLDFVQNIQVLEATLLRGPQETLCLLQRVRIGNASAGLRLLDAGANRAAMGAFAGDDPPFPDDPETAALWRRRAQDNGSWVRFEGTAIVVSLPTTPRRAALSLREGLEDSVEGLRVLSRSLTSIEITGEEALLSFAPGDDGWIHFSSHSSQQVSTAVAELLDEQGAISDGDLELEIQRLLALE